MQMFALDQLKDSEYPWDSEGLTLVSLQLKKKTLGKCLEESSVGQLMLKTNWHIEWLFKRVNSISADKKQQAISVQLKPYLPISLLCTQFTMAHKV